MNPAIFFYILFINESPTILPPFSQVMITEDGNVMLTEPGNTMVTE